MATMRLVEAQTSPLSNYTDQNTDCVELNESLETWCAVFAFDISFAVDRNCMSTG